MANLGTQGTLAVVPPAQLELQLQQKAQEKAQAAQASLPSQNLGDLVGYIKGQFEIFRNHRNTINGWSDRLLHSMRAFNGQYSPTQLAEITKYGGSLIYARVTAQKCRAASSLLRDIYLGQDRPWAVRPPADPDVDPVVLKTINSLLQQEQQMMQQHGQPPNPMMDWKRRQALLQSAEDAAKKKAVDQARESEDRIEDMLREGGYYTALAEFLVDLPVFPFAVIKGPVVKVLPELKWPPGGGSPTVSYVPKLTWNRVSPFDLWFTPGVADIKNANCIEKLRVTRAELNDLLDLPGYNQDEIMAVLEEYGRGGLYDNWDITDSERAILESRENPAWNRSGLISMMEFNGNVQGRVLQDYGLAVPDALRDYSTQVWCIGSHVIKAHLSPSPRQRHPYFITSFEKVPGTPVGNSLVDLLSDIQEAANAHLRALVNNSSISSGPQVMVNDSRLSTDETGEEMFPWKRWHYRDDPLGPNGNKDKPLEFFMPTNNSAALMQVFKDFVGLADDISAIPKYVGGEASSGGAGRTASGLAMLMGNASKILQTVAANIDRDVLEPSLMQLTDLILLTDTTGLLSGEEKISVQGVSVAMQRETLRQRQLEFLQTTNNPTDMSIIGIKGRADVLRSVSGTIGLSGEDIVPPEQVMEQKQQAAEQQQQNGPIMQQINKGVMSGVEQGVKRITTELAAGGIAAKLQIPEGPPVHIGTPEPGQGGPPGQPAPGALPAGNNVAANAAQAQGNQPPHPGGASPHAMAPQTNTVGPPTPNARPVSPGPA